MPLSQKDADELEKWIDIIGSAATDLGLDPYQTNFEVVPPEQIYELGSYGLPGRFSHWTHGRDYHKEKTSYDHGRSKIYEIVFNTDPTQAFLMEGNSMLAHKFVVAHVMGHSDFFKRNNYYAHTNRQMIEKVRLHADRIREYENEFGWERVEDFLDLVLTIQYHFDVTSISLKKKSKEQYESDRKCANDSPRTDYDDLWNVTPRNQVEPPERKFPPEPERDVMLFLATYSRNLEEWQRDILHMIREEMYYFLPQMQTKIANEGFAVWSHEKILENIGLTPSEHLEFRILHSSVVSPGSPTRINPYYIGYKVLKDIERRWDGIVTPHDKIETDWLGREITRPSGKGREKLFEVVEMENDVSLLRKYLSESLINELDLYTFKREPDASQKSVHAYVVQSREWEKVRDNIVDAMTNFGMPIIKVEDADYQKNGELLLTHDFDGKEIHDEETVAVLNNIEKLWGRKVHLHSQYKDGSEKHFFSDGKG